MNIVKKVVILWLVAFMFNLPVTGFARSKNTSKKKAAVGITQNEPQILTSQEVSFTHSNNSGSGLVEHKALWVAAGAVVLVGLIAAIGGGGGGGGGGGTVNASGGSTGNVSFGW